MNNDKISLNLNLKSPTRGVKSADISDIFKNEGIYSYDSYLQNTISCNSKISYVDGVKGDLYYRGYSINDIVDNCTYLETSYLLLNAKLPTIAELSEYNINITNNMNIDDDIINLFKSSKGMHPMGLLITALGYLASKNFDSFNIHNKDSINKATIDLIAKIPVLSSLAYRKYLGLDFVYPIKDIDYTSNFLYMMFCRSDSKYEVNPLVSDILNKIFILHADHGQNASTSTVRLCGSSLTNVYAAIASGVASLWGKLHGGANEAVLNMLSEIKTVDNINKYLDKAKDKSDPFRLMGIGHRVYKNYDPRAKILKKYCFELVNELGINNDIIDIAIELEKRVLSDEYFVSRKLYPNVDFYSGIIFKAMGIPNSMFTVLFVLARTSGWLSQWNEMISDKNMKIIRPRQMYSGDIDLSFIKIEDRT